MKLSPTQLRVLRYASEGQLWRTADGGFFVPGIGVLWLDWNVAATDLERDGLTGSCFGVDVGRVKVRVTPKGAALLEEQESA